MPAHVYLEKAPGSMGTKMIEGQDGVGPVWDGVTMPWNQFGQPLRLVRITYKVSRDQMEGKKPITERRHRAEYVIPQKRCRCGNKTEGESRIFAFSFRLNAYYCLNCDSSD